MYALGTGLDPENNTWYGIEPIRVCYTWRYVYTSTKSPIGAAIPPGIPRWADVTWHIMGSCSPNSPSFGGSTVEYGNWTTGGVATPGTSISRAVGGLRILSSYVANFPDEGNWGRCKTFNTTSEGAILTIVTSIEIKTDRLMTALANAGFDGVQHKIYGVRAVDADNKATNDLVKNGLVNRDDLNKIWSDYTRKGGDPANFSIFNPANAVETKSTSIAILPNSRAPLDFVEVKTVQSMVGSSMDDSVSDVEFTQQINNIISTGSGSVDNSGPLDMCILVYVARQGDNTQWADPEKITQPKPEPEPTPKPDPELYGVIFDNGGGGGGGGGSSDTKQGNNTIYSKYGNSVLPFDSIYLTGDNFNQFLSSGGGIITDGLGGLDNSGIFPNSATMYIDQIRVDVEGSSMTIIEAVDFDATPSLDLTTKVYGYILDSGGNQTKPSFVGYVTSRKRRLSSGRSEIVYECKDLIHFLSQFYTQSHYIYRPPSYEGQGSSKTYDRIIKEVLNVAGIPTALIDIPDTVAPPVRWIYQTVRTVLEWASKYFGKYVYFVDRYGRLNFKATDSGSFIKNFTIPTKGDPVGSNRVSDFSPITDFSRSRSQVVLTGDFPIKENRMVSSYGLSGKLDPNLCRSTGFYWFDEVIDGKTYKFYYFKFVPNQTLNPQLLSDPSVSAKVSLVQPRNYQVIEELSIRVFKHEPGDSEIYVESPTFAKYRNITLRIEYATRGNSPIQVVTQTGLFGGTEIVRRPEFKKAESLTDNIDDTPIMEQYLNKIKDFYKPVYGGSLTLEYLDTDLELLGKVSIQNTSLPSEEADNLICYSITYDIPNKRTIVDLSNKVYGDLAFFDIIRETSRENSELRAKLGLIEETQLYYRK